MSGSVQATFGSIKVNEYSGERQCDSCVGFTDSGHPKRCKNSAFLTILRSPSQVPEFFCKTHSKDTWIEMAQE